MTIICIKASIYMEIDDVSDHPVLSKQTFQSADWKKSLREYIVGSFATGPEAAIMDFNLGEVIGADVESASEMTPAEIAEVGLDDLL